MPFSTEDQTLSSSDVFASLVPFLERETSGFPRRNVRALGAGFPGDRPIGEG